MFLLNWFLQRPEPEFAQEQIVLIDDDFSEKRFMLIRSHRWARPNRAERKCWVYDGPVFSVVNGQYVLLTYGYHYREEALAPILEYGGGNVFGT